MTPTRRGLLTGLTSSLILSPAVIRVADLMPIKPFWLRTVDDLPWKPHPIGVLPVYGSIIGPHPTGISEPMWAHVDLGNRRTLSVLKGSSPWFYSNGRDTFEVGLYDYSASGGVAIHSHVAGPEVIRMIERGGVALV